MYAEERRSSCGLNFDSVVEIPSDSFLTQGLDLVFGGVLDHFLARETALARPDMPLLDRFFRA